MKKVWDVFISHASEDKESFVKPLVEVLTQFGVKVWYDEFSLQPGDSLSRSIDKGLAKSRYGLVILSPSFLSKKWPEYELQGLVTKEIIGEKTIIPIWHNITIKQLAKFSPSLADKLAILTKGRSILQISLSIIDLIRPDIFARIHSRIAFYKQIKEGEILSFNAEQILSIKPKGGPIRHNQFPPDLIRRMRFIRAALLEEYPLTMKSWIDGFQRDSHPSNEIGIWEEIAAILLEYKFIHKGSISLKQRIDAFNILLTLSMGTTYEQLLPKAENLSEKSLEFLIESYISHHPMFEFINDDYEIEEDSINDKEDHSPDKEDFNYNIPDELIKKIIKENEDQTKTKK